MHCQELKKEIFVGTQVYNKGQHFKSLFVFVALLDLMDSDNSGEHGEVPVTWSQATTALAVLLRSPKPTGQLQKFGIQ